MEKRVKKFLTKIFTTVDEHENSVTFSWNFPTFNETVEITCETFKSFSLQNLKFESVLKSQTNSSHLSVIITTNSHKVEFRAFDPRHVGIRYEYISFQKTSRKIHDDDI